MALGKFLLVPAAVLALAYTAPAAHAGTLTIKDTSYRIGVGGEFNVTGFDDGYLPPASAVANGITSADAGNFKTFCMERNEFITLGTSYLYEISTIAYNGGISGQDPILGGDPISEATAKLYYAFYTGQLPDYDYTTDSGRGQAGGDLQHALWRLEGELNDTEWADYIDDHEQAEDFYDVANSVTWSDLGRSTWTGIGDVRVVNLYNSAGVAKQSQLVVVPLPPAAFMGLALLAGLAGAKSLRKRMLARRLA
jgi:hypothetical protein